MLRWSVLVVATVAGTWLMFQALVYCGSTGQIQAANMARAERQLPLIQTLLINEPRWSAVNPSVYTDQMGSILLFGRVEAAGDLCRLMRAVADLKLSVPVCWLVKVNAEQKP